MTTRRAVLSALLAPVLSLPLAAAGPSGQRTTVIPGGPITRDSVRFGNLRIGSLGVRAIGIDFEFRRDAAGILDRSMVHWTAGQVLCQSGGGTKSQPISAGSARVLPGSSYTAVCLPQSDPFPGSLCAVPLIEALGSDAIVMAVCGGGMPAPSVLHGGSVVCST